MPSTRSRFAAFGLLLGLLLGAACTGGDQNPPDAAAADTVHGSDGVAVENELAVENQLAAAESDAFTLVVDDVLTLCVNVPLPPFTVEDPDADLGYGGFDVDLAAKVAARLELDLAVERVAFEAITSGAALAEGRCDVAASALTVTDEWERHLDFTAPYFEVKQSLLMLDDATPAALEASGGMRLGVQTGMPAERFAERESPNDAEVVPFDNTTDLLAALATGEVDAVVQDLPTSTAWVTAEMGVSVVETFVTDDAYAMAVGAGRPDALLRMLDTQLATLRADGTRERLLAKHFATPTGTKGTADG